jgi:hypothetical protein
MDGFKSLPKMACFKEGGHAKKEAYCGGGSAYKKGGEVMDEKQDKAMIKKAFKQHDEAEHDKEPTEIKLRKGGRASKKEGTVRKFKIGGSVVNTYEAKKSSGDLDNIKKIKDIKPGKADAPNAATKRPNFMGSDVEKEQSKLAGDKDKLQKYKKGGNVKKMAIGGDVVSDLANAELLHQKEKEARAKRYLSLDQQKQLAQQQEDAYKQYGPKQPGVMPPVNPMGDAGVPAQKRGGRVGRK